MGFLWSPDLPPNWVNPIDFKHKVGSCHLIILQYEVWGSSATSEAEACMWPLMTQPAEGLMS